jgi:hypothetical protein
VVLRGAGSQGAPSGTTIVKTGGQTVLAIGPDRDATCYGGTGYSLTQDGAKEATSISLGPAVSNFAVGDLALVDLVDDSSVQQGDCSYFKRTSGRSASQRVEIVAVDAANGRLTLGSPLHWNFRSANPYLAQITRAARPVTQTGNVTALQFDGGDIGMNVVGNVLGTAGISTVPDAYDSGPFSIYELGAGGSGATDVAAVSLVRQGNYDYFSKKTLWTPANVAVPLPTSLYLASRPAWWPAGTPWPWVGPDLTPMVGALPAKDRAAHIWP